MPCTPAAAREARQFVSEQLSRWGVASAGPDCFVNDAVLVASELVANAVRYCSGEVALCLECRPAYLEIAVRDHNPELPEAKQPDMTAESGRGLAIVAALCSEWGVRPEDSHGKVVWGRIATRAS